MLEFLKDYYYIPIYGIALIISIVRYRWYFDGVLKYFPMIIAYTLLSEILGYLILNYEDFQIIYNYKYPFANNFIFNIFDIVFFLYFYKVFWRAIDNQKSKTLIKYGAVLFVIASIINPFFQNILLFAQVYAIAVGSLVLIICSLFYLKQVHTGNKNILLTWVSIGLLIFYTFYPIIMLSGGMNYDFYVKFHLNQVLKIIIVGMYLCFIIGFIQLRRTHTQHTLDEHG